MSKLYRGRLAPTPTGHLHLGHARTFWIAQSRARAAGGELVLRVEDLDEQRCKPQYYVDMLEDLTWFGFEWQAGPFYQRDRLPFYLRVWRRLSEMGVIYPSPHSRKDVAGALSAPHEGDREVVFPVVLRPEAWERVEHPGDVNWRFRVPDGVRVEFVDLNFGPQRFVAGENFGDFIVWRRDGFPSYELAVVADDHDMGISEVVRGKDLLLNTAKQILLYRALGWKLPDFFHCELVRDEQGRRLAKRDRARSLRGLKERGIEPGEILSGF